MSWLARSIANSLKFDDDEEYDVNRDQKREHRLPENSEPQNAEVSAPTSPSRGVKEDLSELSKTLTRQFWGVASFLAPPPQPEQKSGPDASEPEQGSMLGIRGDFTEIGGKFRSGISRLSNNINVSEITKMASNFLQLESDEDNEERGKMVGLDSLGKGAVGVTEEVMAFARDISMHPETWLNFPLPENVEDDVEFDMSDTQQEHALAVEQLVPRLAAVRIQLCPVYMSESRFWKIYFVVLHPIIDKEDAKLLSTPQTVEARFFLEHELKSRKTSKQEDLPGKRSSVPDEINVVPTQKEPILMPSPSLPENKFGNTSGLNVGSSTAITTSEIGKHSVERNEIQIEDKSIVAEKDVDQRKDQHVKSGNLKAFEEEDEDDVDDWLKEEASEIGGAFGKTIPEQNEDDVSFSDLEEDDGDAPTSFRKSNDSSDKDSRDWVRLGNSSSDLSKHIDAKHSDEENANDRESKESNDWLDVDDIVVS